MQSKKDEQDGGCKRRGAEQDPTLIRDESEVY